MTGRVSKPFVGLLGNVLVFVSLCSAAVFLFRVVFLFPPPGWLYSPWVWGVTFGTHVAGWSLLWLYGGKDNYGLERKDSRSVLSWTCALVIVGAALVLLGLGQYGQWRAYRDAPRCAPAQRTPEPASASCINEQAAAVVSIRVDTSTPGLYNAPTPGQDLEIRLADGSKHTASLREPPLVPDDGPSCKYSNSSSASYHVSNCEVPVKARLYHDRVVQLTLPGGQRTKETDQQPGRYRLLTWLGALCLLGALWPLLPLGLRLRRAGRRPAAPPAAEDGPSTGVPASMRRVVRPRARTVLAALFIAAAIAILVVSNQHGPPPDKPDRLPPPARTGALSVAGLLDRVPGDAYHIAAIDLEAAKRQLGVRANLAPRGRPRRESDESPLRTFDAAAVTVLGYLTGLGDSSATATIDHGLVTAAVEAIQSEGRELVILATRQPIEQIKRRLETAGLRPAVTDVYAEPNARPGEPLTVAGVAHGLLILGDTPYRVSAALQRTRADPRLSLARGLLERTRGALRVVRTFRLPRPEAACVQALAGGELITQDGGVQDLVVSVSGKPQRGSVTFAQGSQRRDIRFSDYRVKNVTTEGQTVDLSLRHLPRADSYGAARIAEVEEPDLIYRCPERRPR